MSHSPLNKDFEMQPLPSQSTFPSRNKSSNVSRDEILGGDFTCILRGYPKVLSLDEMRDKAENTHQVDVPREKKLSCCFIILGLFLFILFFSIYFALLTQFDYHVKDSAIITMEICAVVAVMVMGMCLFRWCSLNDISPKAIWERVAITQATPLRMIKFDMEHVGISFLEYHIDYGEYPHNLHEPVITLEKEEQICNARDLVKITKKEPKPDEAYSYGAIYFHFKGQDEYLLERWKYDFEKNHNKVGAVHKKCNKFHSVFFQHFGYKFRYKVVDENGNRVPVGSEPEMTPEPEPGPHSKYLKHATTLREKEDDVIDILDAFAPKKKDKPKKETNGHDHNGHNGYHDTNGHNGYHDTNGHTNGHHVEEEEEEDAYYDTVMNTHDPESSSDRPLEISPILLGKQPSKAQSIQDLELTPCDDDEQYLD